MNFPEWLPLRIINTNDNWLTASSTGHYCNKGRISRSIGTNFVQWILINIYSKWTGLPQNMYLTDLAHHKKLHISRGIDLPYIPRWVTTLSIVCKLLPREYALSTPRYLKDRGYLQPKNDRNRDVYADLVVSFITFCSAGTVFPAKENETDICGDVRQSIFCRF